MWFKKDPKGLTWNELLCLYRIIDARERGFREDLFRFTNFYSAVCFAVLGVTLSGLVSVVGQGQWKVLYLLSLGPIVTLCMCFLGLRVTGQIYRRIQDETSAKAKIENTLGLDGELLVTEFLGKEVVWQEDTSLLPERHAKRRFMEKSSHEFVDRGSRRKGGANTNNKLYFGIIAVAAVILVVTILVLATFGGKIS